MKYIEADLLWKEMDKLANAMSDAISDYSDGVRFALNHFVFVIDSLQQEQPEPPSLTEKAIVWFNNIAESAKKLSAGNVSHLGPTISGMAIRSGEFLEKHRQEWPEVDLEKASRNVYESWMGGTMDDVRRDMVELGKILNARKED